MSPIRRRALLLAAGIVLAGADAAPTFLDVTVEGVRNARGRARVAVCTERTFLAAHCEWFNSEPARAGAVTVRVAGMPPGTYAIQAYHDENENHQIDRNWLGMPTEGIGFSRDARFRFGPPRFADAAVTVGAAGGVVTVRLLYLTE